MKLSSATCAIIAFLLSTGCETSGLARTTAAQCLHEQQRQARDECYFEPRVNFTFTGTPLQGISSDLGFTEAGHLCLQVPECHAITENDFYRMLLPQKRYVLRGEGELQPLQGTTTLVRSVNQCIDDLHLEHDLGDQQDQAKKHNAAPQPPDARRRRQERPAAAPLACR